MIQIQAMLFGLLHTKKHSLEQECFLTSLVVREVKSS